jgi:hypothetical protein
MAVENPKRGSRLFSASKKSRNIALGGCWQPFGPIQPRVVVFNRWVGRKISAWPAQFRDLNFFAPLFRVNSGASPTSNRRSAPNKITASILPALRAHYTRLSSSATKQTHPGNIAHAASCFMERRWDLHIADCFLVNPRRNERILSELNRTKQRDR